MQIQVLELADEGVVVYGPPNIFPATDQQAKTLFLVAEKGNASHNANVGRRTHTPGESPQHIIMTSCSNCCHHINLKIHQESIHFVNSIVKEGSLFQVLTLCHFDVDHIIVGGFSTANHGMYGMSKVHARSVDIPRKNIHRTRSQLAQGKYLGSSQERLSEFTQTFNRFTLTFKLLHLYDVQFWKPTST